MSNLSRQLDNFMHTVFLRVDGVLVEKCYKGYKVFGVFCYSFDGVREEIKARKIILSQSIINKK